MESHHLQVQANAAKRLLDHTTFTVSNHESGPDGRLPREACGDIEETHRFLVLQLCSWPTCHVDLENPEWPASVCSCLPVFPRESLAFPVQMGGFESRLGVQRTWKVIAAEGVTDVQDCRVRPIPI